MQKEQLLAIAFHERDALEDISVRLDPLRCECGQPLAATELLDVCACRCGRAYTLVAEVWLRELLPLRACRNSRCGQQFRPREPRQVYCSSACSARVRQARVRQKASA